MCLSPEKKLQIQNLYQLFVSNQGLNAKSRRRMKREIEKLLAENLCGYVTELCKSPCICNLFRTDLCECNMLCPCEAELKDVVFVPSARYLAYLDLIGPLCDSCHSNVKINSKFNTMCMLGNSQRFLDFVTDSIMKYPCECSHMETYKEAQKVLLIIQFLEKFLCKEVLKEL